MSDTKKKKQFEIPSKFKNVSGFTFTTYSGELMMVFNGFEEERNVPEDFSHSLRGNLGDHRACGSGLVNKKFPKRSNFLQSPESTKE